MLTKKDFHSDCRLKLTPVFQCVVSYKREEKEKRRYDQGRATSCMKV